MLLRLQDKPVLVIIRLNCKVLAELGVAKATASGARSACAEVDGKQMKTPSMEFRLEPKWKLLSCVGNSIAHLGWAFRAAKPEHAS
eukprot:2885038-Amphidinium_carterae.1